MALDPTLFERAVVLFNERDADYQLYHDYYNGDHRLTFATRKFRSAFASTFREFALNFCPTVVDTLADRVQLEGFELRADELTDIERQDERVQEELLSIWNYNRMERRQHEVHHEAFKCGDSYVVVWPDLETNIPVIWPQEAAQIIVGTNVDNPAILDWAMKVWVTSDEFVRVTFYTPEAIYKLISTQKSTTGEPKKALTDYQQYRIEGEPWPVPNPYLRVPVFPFATNVGTENEGRSELRDIIPIQDAINKTVMDMIVGQEFFALPQRWATGIEAETDENGNLVSPFDTATGKLWVTAVTDARFGQFPAADVTMLGKNVDNLIEKVSVISRIPLHYIHPISGDRWPSGESLKTAEAPFIAKITDRTTIFGPVWEDVFAFALEITGLKDVRLKARWKDANPRATVEQHEQFVALLQAQIDPVLAGILVNLPPDKLKAIEEARARAEAEARRIAAQSTPPAASEPPAQNAERMQEQSA